MLDVVVPVGPDCESELRYALRSIAAHLPHRAVWLVGDVPAWAKGARQLPVDAKGTKWERTKANLRAACEHPGVSDRFVLFNDDFYVMQPVSEVPVMHAGYLADWVTGMRARIGKTGYVHALHLTRVLLESLGIEDPLSYDLHTPLVVDKAGMLAALDLTVDNPRLCERTIYGNLAGLGGVQVPDVKAYTRTDGLAEGIAAPFLSTSDRAFGLFPIGRLIRDAFPDECAYERPPAPAPNPRGGRSRKTRMKAEEVTTDGDS